MARFGMMVARIKDGQQELPTHVRLLLMYAAKGKPEAEGYCQRMKSEKKHLEGIMKDCCVFIAQR